MLYLILLLSVIDTVLTEFRHRIFDCLMVPLPKPHTLSQLEICRIFRLLLHYYYMNAYCLYMLMTELV